MNRYFTKEEIDRYVMFVEEQGNEVIQDAIDQSLPAYRYDFPIFFQKWEYYREFSVDIMFLFTSPQRGGILNAINIPGCMAYGKNKKEGLTNFLRAFFEVEDFRHLNKMYKMNQISFSMQSYIMPPGDIKYNELVNDLMSLGWTLEHKAHYNSILINKNSSKKLSITIPNWETIPELLHTLIRKWIMASDKVTKHNLY